MTTRETERLLLRLPRASDLEAFVEIHEDPEVMRHMSVLGQSTGREAGWRLLALLLGHWHLRGYGQWTMVEKDTDQVIGRVGLWHPEGWPGLEVGWVVRRSHWGRGFATEAARAAVEFGFDQVGANHMISIIRPDNVRSIRVAEKLGQVVERTITHLGAECHVYGISAQRDHATSPP